MASRVPILEPPLLRPHGPPRDSKVGLPILSNPNGPGRASLESKGSHKGCLRGPKGPTRGPFVSRRSQEGSRLTPKNSTRGSKGGPANTFKSQGSQMRSLLRPKGSTKGFQGWACPLSSSLKGHKKGPFCVPRVPPRGSKGGAAHYLQAPRVSQGTSIHSFETTAHIAKGCALKGATKQAIHSSLPFPLKARPLSRSEGRGDENDPLDGIAFFLFLSDLSFWPLVLRFDGEEILEEECTMPQASQSPSQ